MTQCDLCYDAPSATVRFLLRSDLCAQRVPVFLPWGGNSLIDAELVFTEYKLLASPNAGVSKTALGQRDVFDLKDSGWD